MLTAERHKAILRLIDEQGRVTVAEIAARFQVSTATARRDAVLLAEAGRAARSHGGLLPAGFFNGTPALRPSPAPNVSAKVRLARQAVERLPAEGTIFVGAGTTCLEVGRLLLERPELRIYTNSIALMMLAGETRANLAIIGGEANRASNSVSGPLAQAWLDHLRFEVAVVGAAAIDSTGAHAADLAEATVRTEVLRRASVRMLVADAAKWNLGAPVRFAPWRSFSLVVSTRELPREARITLAAQKVKLVLAS